MHRSDHSRSSSSSMPRPLADDARDPHSARLLSQSSSDYSRVNMSGGVSKITDGLAAGAPGLNVSARAQSHAVASSTLHQQAALPSKASFSPFSRTTRSSSPSLTMGQIQSDLRSPSPLQSARVDTQSSSMGQKLRMAWPVRRKKTLEPASVIASPVLAQPSSKEKSAHSPSISPQPSLSSSPSSSAHSHEDQGRARNRTSAKQMASQFASSALMAMKGKLNASTTSVSTPLSAFEAPSPPPLPPKSPESRLSTSSQRSVSNRSTEPGVATHQAEDSSHQKASSSQTGVTSESSPDFPVKEKIDTSTLADAESEGDKGEVKTPTGEMSRAQSTRKRERKGDEEKANSDDWRKSDSTLRTVRLVGSSGIPLGSRTPRPLSLAESTNSGNTVQASNALGSNAGKRLSALITDADFGMPEVDSEDDDDEIVVPRNFGIDLGRKVSDMQVDTKVEATFTGDVARTTNQLHRKSGSVSPQSSPCPSPTPGKISKLVKAARRGSNSLTGRFSPSPRRADNVSREHIQSESDHDVVLSGSESEVLSSNSLDGVPSASSSTTSVTSYPSQSAKDTDSSSAFDQYSYTAPDTPASIKSEPIPTPELHPWVSSLNASESSTSLSASATSSSNLGHAVLPAKNEGLSTALPQSSSTANSQKPDAQRNRVSSSQTRGLRQTAVSLTSASAGFAKGFGKRAVDKLGKALSGSSTNVSGVVSGGGSGSSVPSSFHFGGDKSRHSSSRSMSATHRKTAYSSSGSESQHGDLNHQKKRHGFKKGRTPNAPSGTWSVASSDSEAVSNHPGLNMGYLVRRPLNPGQGGFVFGRSLADCVRDTAVRPGTIGVMPIGNGQKRVSRMSLGEAEAARNRVLEERHIPALVARCAQHIEKWGIQEEGLFRVSGRASHISKLRAEFDSGADYDMSECSPSDLDPHAVASVLKAYLRELPESLLTRNLMPYFEAAMHQENSANESEEKAADQARLKGSLPQIRKPPSLSTFAVPTFVPRTPSQSLINAFASLIARLPLENRDLVRTVVELIMTTARRSKDTKMPLSNLLLVFCPSLAMSPPLLRLLCESEGIWDGPIKVETFAEEDSNIDDEEGSVDSDVEDGETQIFNEDETEDQFPSCEKQSLTEEPASRTRSRSSTNASRSRVATIYLPSSPRDLQPRYTDVLHSADAAEHTHTALKDAKSLAQRSQLDASISYNSSSSAPYSPPPLTSDSGSLGTPASSETDHNQKRSLTGSGIASMHLTPRAQSDLPSPRKIRKSSIGNPIAFPAVADSAPVTPVEFLPALRLSSYSSSSPELGPEDGSRRKSKISLQDLLPKRSLSSLLGRSPATPDSTRSFSTPPSQTRIGVTPPILEFSLNQSPIKFDFEESQVSIGRAVDRGSTFDDEKSVPRLDVPALLASSSGDLDPLKSAVSTSSTSSGMFYTPATSYKSLMHAHSESSLASTGSYSLLEFGFNKENSGDKVDDSDDWARSVLAATSDGKGGQ